MDNEWDNLVLGIIIWDWYYFLSFLKTEKEFRQIGFNNDKNNNKQCNIALPKEISLKESNNKISIIQCI